MVMESALNTSEETDLPLSPQEIIADYRWQPVAARQPDRAARGHGARPNSAYSAMARKSCSLPWRRSSAKGLALRLLSRPDLHARYRRAYPGTVFLHSSTPILTWMPILLPPGGR